MSTLPTLTSVSKNALTLKWRDALIGALALILVSIFSFIGGDLTSARDKLRSIPDPAQIVTNKMVDQRFSEQDRKIDDNSRITHESLVRIEGKIDTLVMSMATRRRTSVEADQPSVGVPMTNRNPMIIIPDAPVLARNEK